MHGNNAVIDSYDGAEHSTSNQGKRSIVSYSSQIFSESMTATEEGVSTAQSSNISTWQRIMADEKPENIFPVLESIYEEKRKLKEEAEKIRNGCSFSFYEMHDGKMLYLLTRHLAWSRKHNPLLLCKCKRGEGVTNNDFHVCIPISHDEQVLLYNRSEKQWE